MDRGLLVKQYGETLLEQLINMRAIVLLTLVASGMCTITCQKFRCDPAP